MRDLSKATARERKNAEIEGEAAYVRGLHNLDNPYRDGWSRNAREWSRRTRQLHAAWYRGWYRKFEEETPARRLLRKGRRV